MEDTSFVAPNTSELEHVTTTDETLDNPSPDMETDDNDASVPVAESHPNSATHVSRFATVCLFFTAASHGKREAAVKLEGNVKPHIKLLEEDDLLVSSQLQSFREQVQEYVNDHGAEGTGAHAVFFERSQLSANRIMFRRRRSLATRCRRARS